VEAHVATDDHDEDERPSAAPGSGETGAPAEPASPPPAAADDLGADTAAADDLTAAAEGTVEDLAAEAAGGRSSDPVADASGTGAPDIEATDALRTGGEGGTDTGGAGGGEFSWGGFDPVAGVRALGEMQLRGLRAAGEIVERLVSMVDGDENGTAEPAADAGAGSGPRATGPSAAGRAGAGADRPSANAGWITGALGEAVPWATGRGRRTGPSGGDRLAEGLAQVWGELATRSLQGVVASALGDLADALTGEGAERGRGRFRTDPPTAATPGGGAEGPLAVDVGTGTASGRIDLVVSGRPGRSGAPGRARAATVELWLHNATGHVRRDVRFDAGELRRHDGRVLGATLACDPTVVDEMPARSNRGVAVTLGPLADDDAPGTYHGVLLVAGLPEVALPVRVVVDT